MFSPYRFGIFLALFVIFGGYEVLYQRRPLRDEKLPRWKCNLGLCLLGYLIVTLVFPAGIAGLAFQLEARRWGLLSLVGGSRLLKFALSVLGLDLGLYWAHRTFHFFSFLWRFHRIHHSDRDVDVSTGVRFHPVEILVLFTAMVLTVVCLGTSTSGTIFFEILFSCFLIFGHSNLHLPEIVDSVLRVVVVTPDTHRIHHSVDKSEIDSNFGFIFSFWDRIFRTYTPQPKELHEKLPVGLADERQSPTASFTWALLSPFR